MKDWKQDTQAIRKDIFITAYAGGMAHLASAFSCVEILYALYCGGGMRHDPANPGWGERDRLVCSKGHGSLALYATLYKAGYFDRKTLLSFCKSDSLLGGEPSLNVALGIEASTGSLGHGLSLGVGLALASRLNDDDSHVYVLLGDGECEEGSVWEAVMAAAKYRLNNLTAILDHNRIQKMDTVQKVMGITNWETRFSAFGWNCTSVDGHCVDSLISCLQQKNITEQPRLIIADTVKGKGVTLMENEPAWHWRMPNKRELKKFMCELNISEEDLEQCK